VKKEGGFEKVETKERKHSNFSRKTLTDWKGVSRRSWNINRWRGDRNRKTQSCMQILDSKVTGQKGGDEKRVVHGRTRSFTE